MFFVKPFNSAVSAQINFYVFFGTKTPEYAKFNLIATLYISDIRSKLLAIFNRFLEYSLVFIKGYNTV